MKANTIYLEAAHEGDRLKIGIYEPGDVIWRYENFSAALKKVKTHCLDMMDMLNQTSRNGGGGAYAYDKLKAAGQRLCDELLPRSIKDALRHTTAEYLVLNLDDHLVDIPWELICIDDDFISLRFSMGRMVKTWQEVPKTIARPLVRPLKMWILANPEGNLNDASMEGLQIFQNMVRMNAEGEVVAPTLDAEITPGEIKESIKSYDFIHFAGHVHYDQRHPGQSGWKLAEGHFTVEDIDKMAGGAPMPSLIFSNACQSARTIDWSENGNAKKASFSLTNAFLRSGVKHYVGAAWEVMDEPSRQFAHEFYTLLVAGKSAGDALKESRNNLKERFGPDICWVSYILYGDPLFRYFRRDDIPKHIPVSTPETISRKSILTRGNFFNYSINTAKLKEIQNWIIVFLMIFITAVTIMGGIFVNNWLNTERRQLTETTLAHTREMMIQNVEKQQLRTEKLFDELEQLIEPLPAQPQSEPEPLTLATVFDSKSITGEKEKIILHAIQAQIMESKSIFTLLEYESFDIILEELIRKLKLTPPEQRKRPKLLTPTIILIVDTYDAGEKTYVLMRLVEKETRYIIDTLFTELDDHRQILEQKEKIAGELLVKLKTYERS